MSFLKNLHAVIMHTHKYVWEIKTGKINSRSCESSWVNYWHWSVSRVLNVIFHISAMIVQHHSASFLQMFTWCIFMCSQGFFFVCPWIYYLDCAWMESQMCWWSGIPAEVYSTRVFLGEISKNGSFCLCWVKISENIVFWNISMVFLTNCQQ